MNISKDTIIGDVVAKNFNTASIFNKYKIDFCCNGNRSIEDVCEGTIITSDKLIEEINKISNLEVLKDEDYNNWDIIDLLENIEATHHAYIRKQIPETTPLLRKISNVHGENHPELIEIENLFEQSANDLLQHLQKEEMILFPLIRELVAAKNGNGELVDSHCGSVENPVTAMMIEHDNEGVRFRKISKLSNEYTPSATTCGSYKLAFSLLKDFEGNLHKHIHKENNILFPKAIAIEKGLS